MKTKWWLCWAGMAFVLLVPREVSAAGACTCGRFHGWQDMGCNQNHPGAGGAPKKGPCPCLTHPEGIMGMPQWWVSEPYEDLWISDTPLSYTTSSGQEMAFTVYYRQSYKLPNADEFTAGCSGLMPDAYLSTARTVGLTNAAWGHNWMRDIVFWDAHWEADYCNNGVPSYPVFSREYETFVFQPAGGIYYFYKKSTGEAALQDPRSQVRLQPLSALGYPTANLLPPDTNGIYWGDPQTNGFRLTSPDGSQDLFGFCYFTMNWTPGPSHPFTTAHAFLTQRIDPAGRITRIGYEKVTNNLAYRVKYVVDPDGRTNTFQYVGTPYYTPPSFWEVSEIADPYGRTATFKYSASGALTNLADAAGLTSSIGYQYVDNTNYWVSRLTTPYGNTTFSYYNVPDSSVTDGFQQRAISVSEPEGAHQLFMYLHVNASEAGTATAPTVPGQSFDDGNSGANHPGLNYRNTYHWDRRQYVGWPQSAADYQKAYLSHWLWQTDNISISGSVSSERDPSPDAAGQTPGLRTWYNYPGKTSPETEGASPQVSCLARLLPDGASQYLTYNYYPTYPSGNGLVSDNESSYSKPDGTTGVLTNWFRYAANGVDLTIVSNSAGQWWKSGYNTKHQITSATNALNQVTALDWGGFNGGLGSIQWPGGASVNLSYNADFIRSNHVIIYGPNFGRLQTVSWLPSGRSFTINAWTNALPYSVTDDRGVTVTNTWDGLNRLTSVLFPDGTTISNQYYRLDLVGFKDRLNNWTRGGYDGLQHLTAITNANNAVTLLSWCGCDALTGILDALTNLTTLNYDNQGNLTNILFADNTSLTYQFDLAGRMTNAFDGAGRALRLVYNNQGLVTNVSGAYGVLQTATFDALNRPISITDANGVTVTNGYDAINELLTRTWLGSGGGALAAETFGYANGFLMAYTNRDNQRTLFGRDGAGRITSVTNANNEVVSASYDSLNNILTLTDGLNHTRYWNYNQYGWLTNKADGLGRTVFNLACNPNGWGTNCWTPQFGNVAYLRDAVGNVTNLATSQFTNSYAYDADNKLISMLDSAIGLTRLTWTPLGQLASESNAWAQVSYTYLQGLRTGMSIGSWNQSYSYDSAWRVQSVTSPAGTFTYQYLSSIFSLPSSLSLPNGASIVNTYDSLARLKETDLKNYWGHTLDGYSYGLDPLGLRTNIVRNLGLTTSSVAVGFDNIGQLTSWLAQESGGAPRLNEQFGFAFDAAHNLHSRTNHLLVQTLNADAADELTSVSRTGTFTLSGATPAPATSVTVNGQAAQTYGDFSFAATNLFLANGNNIFTNIALNAYGLRVTNIVTANLPATVNLGFDNNGNLTNDGAKSLSYDSENQLTNVTLAGNFRKDFLYDGLNRLRIKREYSWNGSSWTKTNETRYIWDGNVIVQLRNSNNVPILTLTRGLDLSGSLQGAGGIGGILAMTESSGVSSYFHSDGMGNVTALMDASENIVARRAYGSFGNTLFLGGTKSGINPFWFSSQLHDETTDIYSYEYRPYTPNPPRWLNQDPAQEWGGINLYRFVFNNPFRFVDTDGKAPQLVGVTYDFNTGQTIAQYQPYQFGQGYGIGLHTPPFNPFSEIANDLDIAWNYGLDQITPPINPNTDPYAYYAAQTAREVALAALLAAATDRIGSLGGKKVPCRVKTGPNLEHLNELQELSKQLEEQWQQQMQALEESGDILNMAKKADVKFIDYLQKKYKFGNYSRDYLHDLITKQNLTKQQIEEIAKEFKGGK